MTTPDGMIFQMYKLLLGDGINVTCISRVDWKKYYLNKLITMGGDTTFRQLRLQEPMVFGDPF